MAKKEEELFKEWVADLEGKLKNDEERQAFAIYSKSEAGIENLRGSMRRAEFDRRLNTIHETQRQLEVSEATLKAERQRLEKWFNDEQPKNANLVAELSTLKSRLREFTDEDAPPPAAATAAQGLSIKNEDFERLSKRLDLLDGNLPRVMGDMTAIIKRSLKEDIDIDPREVIAYSIKHQVDPFRAYEDLTHDTRAERFQKEREDSLAAAREEGRKDALKTIKSSPDHIRTPGPNVVDTLWKNEVPTNKHDRVAGAVKEFLEMGAQS